GGGGVRVDDGVFEGGEVSIFYDPMIAKLITWAPTRDGAADLQVEALDAFRVEGPGHNIDFLSAIMQHPRFRSGELTTGFIAEEYPDGFQGAAADEDRLRLVAALMAGAQCSLMAHEGQISGRLDGAPKVPSEWVVKMDGRKFEVELGDGGATVDGEWIAGTTDWQPGTVLAAASGNGENLAIQLRRDGSSTWSLTTRGKTHKGLAVPARIAPLLDHMIEKEPPDLSKMLICPMPGLLVKLHVEEGEEVQPGQPLATVEAMKMENILRAEKEGTISSINAAEGDSLAVDEVILELE
ncbi:MAG: acetyl/propionyl-CoA carboxylase subunit alpha, partial [Citromicrobium sp.]|nr:acetyl/propionyl-CoA carboxylase subunit alpha [Citromicrobium sp.]